MQQHFFFFYHLRLDCYDFLSAYPSCRAPLGSFFPRSFCLWLFSLAWLYWVGEWMYFACIVTSQAPDPPTKTSSRARWYLSCPTDVHSYQLLTSKPMQRKEKEKKKRGRCVSGASPPAATWSRLTSAQVKNWGGGTRGTPRSGERGGRRGSRP